MPDSAAPEEITDLRALVEARRREESVALGVEEQLQVEEPRPKITPEFVEDCILGYNNERGEGVLYITMMRDRFVYVKKREKRPWMVWRQNHWEIDVMDEHVHAVEEVAVEILEAAEALEDPINREKELLSEANSRLSAALDRLKDLKKPTEADRDKSAIEEVEAQRKEADAEKDLYLGNYKTLQRKKKKYIASVERLRSKPGAEKCVWWAHHITNGLSINGKEIDQKPMLLPCPNGVIDLTTGKLKTGRPQDYLERAIPIEYPEQLGWEQIRRYLETGEEFMFPAWQNFISDLVPRLSDGKPDQEVLLCLQKLLGNSITGDPSLHKIVIVIGDGRNGKGVMFRTVESILGDFAWTIKSKLLLDQKNQTAASGPSPEIMALKNRRMVVASETDKHRYISAAQVKEFSGGDKLNARGLFDEEDNFKPTHHLWLQTNNIPGGLFKEFSLRQRLVVFDFPFMYVDDPELESRKEPHNAHRFRKKDESIGGQISEGLPYILLWLIRGALLVQRDGLQIPDKLRGEMEGLQLLEDHLEQFLRGCCLQDWDTEKDYEEGDLVNVKDAIDPERNEGRMYRSIHDAPQGIPGESDSWSYQGPGLDPEKVTLFKEFYDHYEKWYRDNITDKKDGMPSKKSVAGDMRKKGYDVHDKGGQSKIFSPLRVLV